MPAANIQIIFLQAHFWLRWFSSKNINDRNQDWGSFYSARILKKKGNDLSQRTLCSFTFFCVYFSFELRFPSFECLFNRIFIHIFRNRTFWSWSKKKIIEKKNSKPIQMSHFRFACWLVSIPMLLFNCSANSRTYLRLFMDFFVVMFKC